MRKTPLTQPAVVQTRIKDRDFGLNWPGQGTFVFTGVELGKDLWLRAVPENANGDALPGIFMVRPMSAATKIAFPLARASVLDEIFSVAVVPTARSRERAQVLVFFWDAARNLPGSGLQVSVEQAEFVAYGSTRGWSALPGTTTGDLGVALAANVLAAHSGWESWRTVKVSGAATGAWQVHVEPGMVTLVEITLAAAVAAPAH